jgi:hydroxymethylpyrimidine pyrophosphatase-like HAD family hydrolase
MDTVDKLGHLGEEIVKVVARHPDMHASDLFAAVRSVGISGVELTYSLAPYVEMAGTGISKAFGLARLAESRGIDVSEIAAIGDAMNDFAMLSWAGTALAPANAVPEIAAVVHRILPSNEEDAVAVYLESLLDLQ